MFIIKHDQFRSIPIPQCRIPLVTARPARCQFIELSSPSSMNHCILVELNALERMNRMYFCPSSKHCFWIEWLLRGNSLRHWIPSTHGTHLLTLCGSGGGDGIASSLDFPCHPFFAYTRQFVATHAYTTHSLCSLPVIARALRSLPSVNRSLA
jgi:hypothetical protein